MNKGSIVKRLCSDLDRKEPRYKSLTLLYFTLLYLLGGCWGMAINPVAMAAKFDTK